MATAHLPSMFPHPFTPFDPLKTEKYLNEEHEYEISKWLKLENEPLPGLSGNSYISTSDLTSSFYSAPGTHSSQLPTLQPEFSNHYSASSFNFSVPSSTNSTQSNQLPPNNQMPTTHHSTTPSQPQYSTAPYSYPVYHATQYPNQYQTIQYTTGQPQYTTAQTQYSSVQYSSSSGGAYTSQFAPSTTQYTANPNFTTTQFTNGPYTTTQYLHQPAQYANTQQQYTQSIVPAQIFQSQYTTVNSSNGTYQPTQFQYLVYQHQMLKTPQQSEELSEDKKRKQVRPFVRRLRQTRPKVVEAKGAVQCKGRNRKKGTQCRNAALMEYIGPRPIYCAEHIELDPKSLYEKCKSSYQKEPGDNKGCKEVVLKEFGVCYKHYPDLIQEMIENREYEKTRKHGERITELLAQLERDAAVAKKKDGDLYQRKNKLIPKFQEMKKLINKALEALDSCRHKDFAEALPSDLAQLSPPIVLDGISVHVVETFTSSEDDEDLLSSPHSDSSLEEEFEQILN